MMSDRLIKVENVSKKYCRSIKHTMLYGSSDLTRSFLGIHNHTKVLRNGEFWAVNNVSFDIESGECLGLIGPNGSGKSTILKMLNGILMPDRGRIEVKGRVGALIEIGTGFHPMLTGRENIYVNGTIIGMTKKEIDDDFDKIVEFADIGEFIDSPVKHYSSGMYVRLGFAIAAHSNPDILLIDEVLAVGDEAFRRKCFAYIETFRKKGGTILLVSHSTSNIMELCKRTLLLDQGELLLSGASKLAVNQYHRLNSTTPGKEELVRKKIRALGSENNSLPLENEYGETNKLNHSNSNKTVQRSFFNPSLVPESTIYYEPISANIENPRITTLEGDRVNLLARGQEYVYTYNISFFDDAYSVRCGMTIKTSTGFELGGAVSNMLNNKIGNVAKGKKIMANFRFRCMLLPGIYFLNAGIQGIVNKERAFLHRCIDAAMFEVLQDDDFSKTGVIDFFIEPYISFA